MNSYEIYLNSLYVIESLKKDELKTGKLLYEDILPYSCIYDKFSISFSRIDSKEDLFEILDTIEYDVKEKYKLPIIHIEAHGDDSGFELFPSKDVVFWRNLVDKLSKINFLARNNLVLSLGICKGFFINLDLIYSYGSYQRCPYTICISPQTTITNQEIKDGFTEFYKVLIEGQSFNLAMETMSKHTKLNYLSTADWFARKIVDFQWDYIRSKQNKEMTWKQVKMLKKKGKLPLEGKGLKRNYEYTRSFKSKFFREHLEKMWNTFLMIDLGVENKNRFPSFESIWREK